MNLFRNNDFFALQIKQDWFLCEMQHFFFQYTIPKSPGNFVEIIYRSYLLQMSFYSLFYIGAFHNQVTRNSHNQFIQYINLQSGICVQYILEWVLFLHICIMKLENTRIWGILFWIGFFFFLCSENLLNICWYIFICFQMIVSSVHKAGIFSNINLFDFNYFLLYYDIQKGDKNCKYASN